MSSKEPREGWGRGSRGAWFRSFSLVAAALLGPSRAWAGLSLNPSQFTQPLELLNASVVKPILQSIGLVADHRAYQPATPLGTEVGLDVGVQVVLVKLPSSFNQALENAGSGAVDVPFVPLPLLNIHKGIGSWLDVGASGVEYQKQWIAGFDVKAAVYHPDEGPTVAIRMNYGMSSFRYSSSILPNSAITITTETLKPEVLISKRLAFADPYLGVGYEWTRGNLGIAIPVPSLGTTLTGSTSAEGGAGEVAFVGVAMRVPYLGVELILDEEYSTIGADTMGVQAGFSF